MTRARAVHTVESLLARTEEVGECRVWTGYSCNKTPQVEHEGKIVSVRRLIVQLRGDPIKGKFFGVKCHTELCVCPEHIIQRSAVSHARVMAKASAKHQASKSLAQVIARRKRTDIKMDMDKAREIRKSEESGQALAVRYGVSRSLINKVKRGVYWKDSANPFAGLF